MADYTHFGEQHLTLPDGRTLAYDHSGDKNSSTIVLSFHGAFNTGDARGIGPYLRNRGVHYIAPTLPGWGESSPIPNHKPYIKQFVMDTNELLEHLHPNNPNLNIYVSGVSYGAVFAQIVYGAPLDTFPMGSYLKGCLLVAPLSPYKYDKAGYKAMSWINYLAVGPPARALPFHLLPRLATFGMRGKFATVEKSEELGRQIIFDKMTKEERAEFQAWTQRMGRDEGEVEKSLGEQMHKSVSKTWEGYYHIADVCTGDWGFHPTTVNSNRGKMIVIAAKQDDMAPVEMARYLGTAYPNATLIEVDGGHIAGVYRLENTWPMLLDG